MDPITLEQKNSMCMYIRNLLEGSSGCLRDANGTWGSHQRRNLCGACTNWRPQSLILILNWIFWDSSPITRSFQRWQVQCLYLSLRAICPQNPLNKIFLVYGYIGITIVMIDSCDDRNITIETDKWFTVGIQLVWWLSNITRTSSWKRLNVWLSNTRIIPSVSDLSSTQ